MNKKKVLLKYTTEEFFDDPAVLRRIIYAMELGLRQYHRRYEQLYLELVDLKEEINGYTGASKES